MHGICAASVWSLDLLGTIFDAGLMLLDGTVYSSSSSSSHTIIVVSHIAQRTPI